MQSELVEELFASIVATSPTKRSEIIAASSYPQEVKDAAVRLVKAYETKSQLLNDDLLSDIAKADPDFFTSEETAKLNLASDVDFQPGDRIKDYEIESAIGEGGMSVVYQALQTQPIKRRVAIKLIRPSILDPKTILRFFREQQAAALAGHPNVATLYEVGVTDEGSPYAVMELVNGLPISAFCQKHELKTRERMVLFLQACAGLSHAHRHGIVHRDIKPDNILIGVRDQKPIAKLIDFGIAKLSREDFQDDQTVTRFGQILGSPRYMSPEQFDGKPVDQRSDVYSAGLVLFELLARSPYREGETTEEILLQSKLQHPQLLSERLRSTIKTDGHAAFAKEDSRTLIKFVSRDLDWILSKAMHVDPVQRYPTMEAFTCDVEAAMRDQPVTVSKPGSIERSKRFARSNWKLIASSTAVVILLASAFGMFRWLNSEQQLSAFRQANTKSVLRLDAARQARNTSSQQTATANDLIMQLLTSETYELTTDQFDVELIPAYRAQYDLIRSRGGPQSNEEKTVYGILAVLYAMSGDFDLADSLMDQVGADQIKGLRKIREKICEEYATNARAKLELLTDNEDGLERATQQLTLGKCYIVWEMNADATSLLKDACKFFDQNQPTSYDALAARVALARVYRQSEQMLEMNDLLQETHEMFKGNQALLESEKGKQAFLKVLHGLRVSAAGSPVSPTRQEVN